MTLPRGDSSGGQRPTRIRHETSRSFKLRPEITGKCRLLALLFGILEAIHLDKSGLLSNCPRSRTGIIPVKRRVPDRKSKMLTVILRRLESDTLTAMRTIVALLFASACWAQQQPEFDAASVKPNRSGVSGSNFNRRPGGGSEAVNLSLKDLILRLRDPRTTTGRRSSLVG